MKKKPTPPELKCKACDGTGSAPVIHRARPGIRIYPPPCAVCGGKGRISNPTAKKKNEPRRE